MNFTAQDYEWMARAIRLAAKGRWSSPPNPNVGCVLVKDGQLIGEGFHRVAGEGHAEVNAMADARARGYDLRGSRCYVTLEPCCHYGRTPPCANALIEAGINSVVMAMRDPNPKVFGGGMRMLQEAGVEVRSGLLGEQAERLNLGFLSRMRRQRPYVRLKTAISIDGCTALANGKSQWITGPLARQDVQRERACSHAVLSSAATVIADNASLNVRSQELGSLGQKIDISRLRQPVRIILDRHQLLTGQERLFQQDGPIFHVVDRPVRQPLTETIIVPPCANWLEAVCKELACWEINDLWVEAGATLSGAFLMAGLVDELLVYQAGVLLGDLSKSMACLGTLTELSEASRWQRLSERLVGSDRKTVYIPKERQSCLPE
ncbi:MAG: Riboflavin biosynthesis protein RibD [Candidatus Celerinatantimonas neptuna]|nr:MAG: Riboflavin biosynthesis protein RibD [Candidatus Celerinatantimonas neptuna]